MIFEHRSAVYIQVNEQRSAENQRLLASIVEFKQTLDFDVGCDVVGSDNRSLSFSANWSQLPLQTDLALSANFFSKFYVIDIEKNIVTFSELNLNPELLKALHSCGYKKPTPIQALTIPTILNRKDIIATAQTGTGKTAAFVLPTLHHLSLSKKIDKPRALILTPTRELAGQITQAITTYGKFLRPTTASIVGGMPYRQQIRMLANRPDIIISTPGRLLDHMEERRIDLSSIKILILDEADRMLDMGFKDDVKRIINAAPTDRQTLLFSATAGKGIRELAKKILKDPQTISDNSQKIAPVNIAQQIYLTDNEEHKIKLLNHLLKETGIFKGIIFSATKRNADKLAKKIREQGYRVEPLHGDLPQNRRNKTIDRFKKGNIQLIVATDVAARGIHVPDVTHVFNFDLPKFVEDYVHRIGRTGRAGKSGIAISFVTPDDKFSLQRIERYTQQKLNKEVIKGFEPKKNFLQNQEKPKKKKKRWRGR